MKNDFLLRISIVSKQLRRGRRKNPQPISDFGELDSTELAEVSRAEDTPAVFSSSPPRFVETLKILTTEPFFTTLLAWSDHWTKITLVLDGKIPYLTSHEITLDVAGAEYRLLRLDGKR